MLCLEAGRWTGAEVEVLHWQAEAGGGPRRPNQRKCCSQLLLLAARERRDKHVLNIDKHGITVILTLLNNLLPFPHDLV